MPSRTGWRPRRKYARIKPGRQRRSGRFLSSGCAIGGSRSYLWNRGRESCSSLGALSTPIAIGDLPADHIRQAAAIQNLAHLFEGEGGVQGIGKQLALQG